MGESHFAHWPVAIYGVLLLMAGMAYFILARTLVTLHGADSELATALGRDWKGKASMGIYFAAIPLAFLKSWIACLLYALVMLMWLVPDRRIEKTLRSDR
jgi:uncharacterized membrane protein